MRLFSPKLRTARTPHASPACLASSERAPLLCHPRFRTRTCISALACMLHFRAARPHNISCTPIEDSRPQAVSVTKRHRDDPFYSSIAGADSSFPLSSVSMGSASAPGRHGGAAWDPPPPTSQSTQPRPRALLARGRTCWSRRRSRRGRRLGIGRFLQCPEERLNAATRGVETHLLAYTTVRHPAHASHSRPATKSAHLGHEALRRARVQRLGEPSGRLRIRTRA